MNRLRRDQVVAWCILLATGCTLPPMYHELGRQVAGATGQGGDTMQEASVAGRFGALPVGDSTLGTVDAAGAAGLASSTLVTNNHFVSLPYAGSSAAHAGSVWSIGGKSSGASGSLGVGGLGGADSTLGSAGSGGTLATAPVTKTTVVVRGGAPPNGSAGKGGTSSVSTTKPTSSAGGTASKPPSRSAVIDAVHLRTFAADATYQEVVASTTEIYLLTTSGGTEVLDRRNPEKLLFTTGTNFTALDYVSGWNLIATRDWIGSRGVFIDAFAGVDSVAIGDYPPGMNAVTEVAAYQLDPSVRQLRVCVIGHQDEPETELRLQCGTHVPGSSPIIDWDDENYPVSETARGLAAMVEDGVGYLVQLEYVSGVHFVRFAAPDGTRQHESLLGLPEHQYVNPDFRGTSNADVFAPLGFDYSEDLHAFYAIDKCYDPQNATWQHCLASLDRDNVTF